ncbi:hypothetical protein [Methylocella sp.]|uniref:hypothetical protein n=1 Tax=Methylocella sp. TaxID=1978226 RepID=UPI0035B01939
MNTAIGLSLGLALLASGAGVAKPLDPAHRAHAPREYYGIVRQASPEGVSTSRLGAPSGGTIGREDAARPFAPEGPDNVSD